MNFMNGLAKANKKTWWKSHNAFMWEDLPLKIKVKYWMNLVKIQKIQSIFSNYLKKSLKFIQEN